MKIRKYGHGGMMSDKGKLAIMIKRFLNGGKLYEHGGKHEGLIDYRNYKADGSTALNTDTVDFLTQEMNEEEKELFMDMYSQGLIDYRGIKTNLRRQKPLSASAFRKNVLKNPEGPATQANLTNEYGKFLGSGMRERTVRRTPLTGKQTRGRQVKVNIYYPEASRMDEDDILIPQGEKGKDVGRIQPLEATEIPIERRERDITMRTMEAPEQIAEEQEVVEDSSPELPPSQMRFDIQGRSDRTGTGGEGGSSDVPTQADAGLYGTTEPQQSFRLLKEGETREKGGRLYKQGGKRRISNQELAKILAKMLSKYNVR